MSSLLRSFWLCVLVFAFSQAAAQVEPATQLSRLAMESGWLKLIHYEPDATSPTNWRSAIHSSDFFLDAEGNVDPLRELQATLSAFNAPNAEDADKHARCRFPARWQWLKSRMDSDAFFQSAINCPAFDLWTRSGSVKSLSIVFATGYLSNPASYYGHTLLKFNFGGGQAQTRLMDVSVNYGAIVGKNDNPFTYIVKSLMGGYDGGFSHINFYFHNHNYGDIELRDLWEYQLNLPPAAVDLVVAHAWEVLGKRYTYRFFRKNCAYRMAELLEIVDGIEIIPQNWPWVIPQATIENLAVANYQGEPVLASVTYLPSRQSRFYEKYLNLPQLERALLTDLVEGRMSLPDQTFQDLPSLSKQELLDALLDYYQFVGSPLDKARKEIRLEYVNALSARYELEPGVPAVRSKIPMPPHLARPPGWLQIGWGHNSVTGDALSVRFRPAYYDVLDTDGGHVRNSALAMGDTVVNIHRDRIRFGKFDLLDVESAKPGLTGLPGDDAIAWKMRIGAEQQRLFCVDCVVARAQGDMGYGRQWTENLFGAAYLGGALQNNRAEQGIGYARTSASLIFRQGENFGLRLGFEYRFPIGTGIGSYGVSDLEARWSLSSRSDFRIKYQHDVAEQVSAGIGMYW